MYSYGDMINCSVFKKSWVVIPKTFYIEQWRSLLTGKNDFRVMNYHSMTQLISFESYYELKMFCDALKKNWTA